MMKATRIVAIFLKDRRITHELARSVLQFLRTAVNLLNEDTLMAEVGGIAQLLIDTLFQHKINTLVNKHKLLVRRVVVRLIRRCGINYVRKAMPESHRPMIAYLEKEKRKKMNKKQREKLLALMGGETEQPAMQDGDEAPGSSDESSDEEDNTLQRLPEDVDSDEDASDDGSDYNDGNGADILPTSAMDIPRVDDIPIVSNLAKLSEKQRMAEMDVSE